MKTTRITSSPWRRYGMTPASRLLGGTADPGNQRKDLCLSFALYKLLRRWFSDLPVHELARPQGKKKIRKLVFDYILKDCERAFRVTGVELSFLQDLFYSKHATVFAGGLMVPLRSLLLSLSMAAATGYIAYPARYMPERMDPADRNRITHGVFITRLMVSIIVLKELLEIFLYVMSRWAKVLLLCKYAQRQCWRHPAVEMVMRFMLFFGSKAKWSQTISQQNLLVTFRVVMLGVLPPLTSRLVICRGVTTGTTAFKKNERMKWPGNLKIDTHIILVWHIATSLCEISFFNKVKNLAAVRRPGPFVQDPKGIRPRRKPKGMGPTAPDQEESECVWSEQYATAASLSNYCTYLVRKALVPENPIVAGMVLDEVIKEIDHVTSEGSIGVLKKNLGLMELEDVYSSLMETVHKTCNNPDHYQDPDVEAATTEEVDQVEEEEEEEEDDDDGVDDEDLHIACSLTRMGAVLGKHLIEVYEGHTAGLWRDLANFWTGFLLHLAVNTRAATHGKHLAGDSELITYLWALLSHAGFRGNAIHGEQGPDQEDIPDINRAVDHAI